MSTHPPYTPDTDFPPTSTTDTSTTDTSTTADSWVEQCQRQFDPGRAARLKNLVDENNAAHLIDAKYTAHAVDDGTTHVDA